MWLRETRLVSVDAIRSNQTLWHRRELNCPIPARSWQCSSTPPMKQCTRKSQTLYDWKPFWVVSVSPDENRLMKVGNTVNRNASNFTSNVCSVNNIDIGCASAFIANNRMICRIRVVHVKRQYDCCLSNLVSFSESIQIFVYTIFARN